MKKLNLYIIVFSAAMLVLLCFYLFTTYNYINEILLQEKIIDRTNEIDRFIDLFSEWKSEECNEVLTAYINKIDASGGTYAELFDGDLNSVSIRTPLFKETPFELQNYPALMELIRVNERGLTSVWFEGVDSFELNIYYRWVNDHDLVVIGVSKYAVDTEISYVMTYRSMMFVVIIAVFVLGLAAASFVGYFKEKEKR